MTTYHFDTSNLEVNTEGRGREINAFTAMFLAIGLGGLFVVFMPFIGLALIAQALALRVVGGLKSLWKPALAPIPVPGEAHLTGTPGKTAGEKSGELAELEAEIHEKRNS